MRHAVVITAAGYSCRFNENSNTKTKKEFLSVNGHSILYRATAPFTKIEGLVAVVVTYSKGSYGETLKALENLQSETEVPFIFTEGGETRQQSVYKALEELYKRNEELGIEYVSIHDGARPFISADLIKNVLAKAVDFGSCAPAIPVNDTLVKKDADGYIRGRLDRTGVCRIQTPQVFRFPEIYLAHMKAAENGSKVYTDDTEIFSDYGKDVFLVEGSSENIKITYRNDL